MRPRPLVLLGVFLLMAVPAMAQRSTATIRGTITDPTQAVVSGAKVAVLNEETGFTRSTVTNTDGLYTFPDIPTGTYRIDVTHAGFKAEVRTKVQLNVADVRAVNVQLSTGDVAEVVNVEVSALQVRTLGGEVSGLVTGEQVRELPLNGRNFLQLATLMPGVSSPDFLNVKDKGLLGGSDLAVSGGGVTSNMWTVDGANNNDVGSNRTILVYPSLEAIEEFKIHRNSYGAEFGGAAGAQINIVTRTGANEFHGDLFYSGRREALNSKNYFLEQAGQDKENLHRNDFGWTFSGPIMKDKLHFFASQEWNRELRGSVRTAQVPSALERVGNFSQPSSCSFATPVDPVTGAPFPGNVIPQDRLSPGGLLYMNLFPQPNTTPSAGCNNWVASLDSPINWRQENIRLDWSVSSKTRLMLRYTQDAWTNGAPNLYSNLWGDDPFPAVDSNWDQPGRSLTAQLTQNIGSSAVNTLSFSYSSNSITITRGGDDPGLSDRLNAAIPSLFPDSIREYGSDRGHPLFWGGIGYGNNLWNEAPFRNNQDLFILKNDYSAVFGKHFVKVGVLGSMNKKNEDSLGNGSNESPQFWGSTGLNGSFVGTGNSLADFLLRDMTFGFSEASAQRQVPQRWKDLEFYAADSWKLSPRMSLDIGVRYSNFYNSYSDDNLASSFDPAAFNPALAGDPCNGLRQAPGSTFCRDAGFLGATDAVNRSLYPQDLNLFAPRIGFAWDVNGDGKMAIRAGFGQFYLRERLSPGLNIASNPPFTSLRTGLRYLDRVDEPCAGCFGVSNGRATAGREQVGATPNNLQWNVSVEREIAPNTTAEIGYVGSKGRNLLKTRDINAIPDGADSNGNGVADRVEYTLLGEASNVRPFQSIGGRITFWDHSGESIYHSLQAQLRSRFGRGSQLQASYTWSRTIANEPLDNSDGNLSATMTVLDDRFDRGLAATHRKHVANASVVLNLPLLEGKSPLVQHLFGDWQIATIAQYASGQALTLFSGSIPGLQGGVTGNGYTDNQRPNRVPGVSCKPSGGPKEQIINPDAFTVNGMRLGTIGDAGRGVCEGPDFKQVDFSLYKNIRVNSRVRMQLRFDVFNIFNRVNFVGTGGNGVQTTMAPPSANISSDGIISGSAPQSSFGQARLTKDPRQAQVGIKLSF